MARTPASDALRMAVPMAEPLYTLRLDTGQMRLALSCQEVADLTGMTLREVWGAIDRGELPATRKGRYKRVAVQELLRYLGLLPDTSAHLKTA